MRKEEDKGRGKGDREADAEGKNGRRKREEAGSERGGMNTVRNLKKG